LASFANGQSTTGLAPDDIIVFGPTVSNPFGHIAIVTAVSSTAVDLIEQNFSPTGTATVSFTRDGSGRYTVADRGSYHVLGWLRAAALPIVVQPGPGEGKDIWTTSVFSYAPGAGGPGGGLDNDELVVGGWGDLYYTLLQFNLTGMPAQASSARLEVFAFTQRGSGTTAMQLDRITAFWDWRIQGTGADRERLWWADRPSAIQCIAGTLPPCTIGQWYSIDITGLYNGWQSGTFANYGVQLRPVPGGDNTWCEFYSSDYSGDPSLRPRLVVAPASSRSVVTFEGLPAGPFFTGVQPPLTISGVTVSGGQVISAAGFFQAPDRTIVYGSSSAFNCPGCLAVMTVTFAATASNVSFFLMNGFGVPVTYLVTDDTGSETLVQLGPNFSGGGTTVTLPSREIRQVLIRSTDVSSWDFFIDTIAFDSN